ncbi:MAG: nucleotide pyrophosphohydrolase [Mucilaginibacter sp.]|nr:nucleotide pyrophosphohydrolase [Mucilaginibacter sp.]
MTTRKRQIDFFDSDCTAEEQIPRQFSVAFKEVGVGDKGEIRVVFNDTKQLGDIINDNAYEDDFYRYHDIFHYSFATLLGWSPCARAMMKKKRKSVTTLDEIEDGARAAITEEAISMIIFNEAKRKEYFEGVTKVSRTTLRFIKEMTENFEVKVRSSREWEKAILKSYEIFRKLIANDGGKVEFDAVQKQIFYSKINENISLKVIGN